MDTKLNLKELSELSPFELKNFLIETATRVSGQFMLNAGRGNPNFLATEPRYGFMQLLQFALGESSRSFSYMPEGVGGFPEKDGLMARFEIFTDTHAGQPGIAFLRNAVSYVRDQLGLSDDAFVYELCEAALGCMYPVPDRMLPLTEKIVAAYVRREMIGSRPFAGAFDLFAVEGGTAAITYLFTTLKENFLLVPGDAIAIGMPVFTPYIEIPRLKDYDLVEVAVNADMEQGWQYPAKELDKLLDPRVKAFFLVNPSNPPSVRLASKCLDYLAEIVKKRPDLIILTDDVYGTFADNFTSIFAVCPNNTVLVYSFSKYFGSTGWRLGVIATHETNVLDQGIAALPAAKRKLLNERYASITTDPAKLKFIDRLVADSRTVALNHTAGLATPAQAQMALFSLFSLMDEHDDYKAAMKRVIRRRKEALYRRVPIVPHDNHNDVDYYHVLDLEALGGQLFEPAFIKWLVAKLEPNEFLFTLADKAQVVLLPESGFGDSRHAARVSLANLKEVEYEAIGKALYELMLEYYDEYRKAAKPAQAAKLEKATKPAQAAKLEKAVKPTQAAKSEKAAKPTKAAKK